MGPLLKSRTIVDFRFKHCKLEQVLQNTWWKSPRDPLEEANKVEFYLPPRSAGNILQLREASVCFAKGSLCGQIVRHVNSYCKDQRRDRRLLKAFFVSSPGERSLFYPFFLSESNHTNLIRVTRPRSCSGCQAAVRPPPCSPIWPREKFWRAQVSLWTSFFLFLTSNLICHSLVWFVPPPHPTVT